MENLIKQSKTQDLKNALLTYKNALISSFSYGDYDEIKKIINLIEKELNKRLIKCN